MPVHRVVIASFAALVAATGGCLALGSIQRLLVFRPAAATSKNFRPGMLIADDAFIPVGDGGDLVHGWWVPAAGVGQASSFGHLRPGQ
jgi:hypothetical protein